MQILIADDDAVNRRMLERALAGWGYELVVTSDGLQAWEELQREEAPQLAILDWMMPGMDGVEICRQARACPATATAYLLLVTACGKPEDIVAGLEAGANDYITKPYEPAELRARVRVGVRVVELQRSLADRVRELEDALGHVKQLQGILPICAYCKKIRTDDKYWHQVEDYVRQHSEVRFSHSICPDCWEIHVQPGMEKMWGEKVPYEE
jgi:DNA-binding response OmpR family regulator